MFYVNKKVNSKGNLAQQTAQIIANVNELENKKLIRLELDVVYLNPQLWKDKIVAINWINCLHHYYCLKRQMKSSATLSFKDINTDELMGKMVNKKPKVLIIR